MNQQQYYIYNPNQEKKVAGPYGIEEVMTKYKNGEIEGTTLVSREGGEKWVQVRLLDPKNKNMEVGACPHCGTTLQLKDYKLAETCPSCGQQLRLPSYDFSSCVKAAFRKYCTFRGRATRAEYWYFMLFTFMIGVLLGILQVCCRLLSAEGSMTIAHIIQVITWAFELCILLPSIAVAVRRMHDRGFSGLCVFLNVVMQILFMTVPKFFPSKGSIPDTNALIITGILLGGSLATSLFVFVQAAMDSNKGTNAYGPSAKYPIS